MHNSYSTDNLHDRERYIDVLKGVAILFVILVHFNQMWNCPLGIFAKVSTIGARVPQLFFVVSAYLTWKSIEKHTITSKWLFKKYKRLAPMFWVALFIAVFVPKLVIGDYSIWNILSHLLLLHGINPYWINSILGVDWYVGDLAIFYLLCPLLKRMIKGIKEALFCCAICLGFSMGTLVLYNAIPYSGISEIDVFFNTFFIIHQLPVLLIGIILYYIIEGIENGKYGICKVVAVTFSISLSVLVMFEVLHLNKKFMTSSFVAGLVFACVFLVAYILKDNLTMGLLMPFMYLGERSYGIYLFHYTIILCAILIPHTNDSFLLWLAFYCIILMISLLANGSVERVEMILRKKFIKQSLID